MREILFRGKRVDNGEWVEGFLELHLVDGDLTKTKKNAFITYDYMDKIGKVYRDRFEVIPETVGQYSGHRDANGAKIYEGDILSSVDGGTWYHQVIWQDHDGAWCLRSKYGNSLGFLCTYLKDFKVVSNIHEHPDFVEDPNA